MAGVAVAASAVGADLLAHPSSAAAAVAWGHPFSYRESPGSGFGPRDGSFHEGQDYPAPSGTPIYAVADGTVSARGVLGTQGAYGNAVYVNHAEGWSSRYAHMVAPSSLTVGQQISRGQYIGGVGNTGRSFGAHLHIELRTNGTAVNPISYIQNAPLAGAATPAPPAPTLEDELATQLWLYTPNNTLLLVDHLNMTIRSLGNQNSVERSAFDGLAYRAIGEPAWTQNFSAFKYITAPA